MLAQEGNDGDLEVWSFRRLAPIGAGRILVFSEAEQGPGEGAAGMSDA